METRSQLLARAGQAISKRDFVAAHRDCVAVIQQFGDDAHAYFLLGILHIEIGQINKATQLFEKAISVKFEPQTYAFLAKCHALKGDMVQALAAARQAPVEQLSSGLSLDTVGVSLSRVGMHENALRYFEKALQLEPQNPAFHYNLAVSSKFSGQFDRARSAFERAIELNPDFYQAHFALSDLGGVTKEQNHIARLQTVQARLPEQSDGALHIGHALAKEFESLNDYDAAFKELARAKQHKKAQFSAANVQSDRLFDWLMKQTVPPAQTSKVAHSNRPIFVMGMPRSGTTLVERIISNHSQVASGGELQDFGVAVKMLTQTPSNQVLDYDTLVAAENIDFTALGQEYLARTDMLRNGKAHLVDKLPFNFFYVGLIRRALPDARIVCLMRDPMDTCVGNYRQLFSINSPYYAYAYDLTTIGQFYNRFRQLAHHWKTLFPDSVRLQSYEDLVRQPEEQVPQLIQFCGLDWEPQCLQVETNRSPVSTASKVQVREAINTRSIGRWRKYEKFTTELQRLVDAP